jgi:hypothetical protein
MTDERCDEITAERMAGWRKKLAEEHATPALLLGIGHDRNSGALVVCTTEDLSKRDLVTLLKGVIRRLEGRR